jgi:hypothetical protein
MADLEEPPAHASLDAMLQPFTIRVLFLAREEEWLPIAPRATAHLKSW